MTGSKKRRTTTSPPTIWPDGANIRCMTVSASTASRAWRSISKPGSRRAALPFPKTHDLDVLLQLVLPVEPLGAAFQSVTRRLKTFGVLTRYPGNDASAAQARRSLADAKAIRKEARAALGL